MTGTATTRSRRPNGSWSRATMRTGGAALAGGAAAEYSNHSDEQCLNAAGADRDRLRMSRFRVLMPQVRDEEARPASAT